MRNLSEICCFSRLVGGGGQGGVGEEEEEEGEVGVVRAGAGGGLAALLPPVSPLSRPGRQAVLGSPAPR